jgi:hypothetical protein
VKISFVSEFARPPCLGLRQKAVVDPWDASSLGEVKVTAISEWIAVDARSGVPHLTELTLEGEGNPRFVIIPRAADRISREDVLTALTQSDGQTR